MAAVFSPPPGNAPQGTFLPGTKVQVGSHRVVIEKYLSEGGFAHVYVVRIPRDNHKHELAVLKRVAVPDKSQLASMRTEVETMKKLAGHKHVVTYKDSHASQLKGGGYEVFLLMEYCSGGGLIDFMNTRLQHRLTEPEILKIFGDITEGVACMHYLKPPLLHRDLKVENVLISTSASSGVPVYKVCDFGSAAAPRPAAKTTEEARLIEDDVQQHTTMQYRSPEMIDVWRKQPIDEKADIWALGVLLYKLCYYTTPFEDVGQMAILNASFKYPPHPTFSNKLKQLIGWMLREDPKKRPNIYQVVKEVCSMRGTEVPIKDIYANRTQSEARNNEQLPSPQPAIGLQKQAPQVQVQEVPDITPMRRGRPTAQQSAVAAQPIPSPARGDPFAALDSKDYNVRSGAVDELSKRFPSLDDFSIAHDSPSGFSFTKPKTEAVVAKNADSKNKESEKTVNPPKTKVELPRAIQPQRPASTAAVIAATTPTVKDTRGPLPAVVHEPPSPRPGIKYADRGVGSSPPLVPLPASNKFAETKFRPIWKVPANTRSISQPRASDAAKLSASALRPEGAARERPLLQELHRTQSQSSPHGTSASSRPSLEGRRPSANESEEPPVSRIRSSQERPRPSSVYLTSNLDYLRDQESARKQASANSRAHSRRQSYNPAEENTLIDIDDIRSGETNELPPRASSSNKVLPSISRSGLSNAKQAFSGRVGDAFKRFENNESEMENPDAIDTLRVEDNDDTRMKSAPTPASSANRQEEHSEHSPQIDETEDLPPEVRRELERLQLAEEERRVSEAAAEYRSRNSTTGNQQASSRASTIQQRVQNLLDEGRQSPAPYKRTAEGYGRYTDTSPTDSPTPQIMPPPKTQAPAITRKPILDSEPSTMSHPKITHQSTAPPLSHTTISTGQTLQQQRTISRPSKPPKSQALQTGSSRPESSNTNNTSTWSTSTSSTPVNPTSKPLPPKPKGSSLAALLAKDLEGVPDYPPRGSSMVQTLNANDIAATTKTNEIDDSNQVAQQDENLESDFSKRYPSLSGIEMVEADIADSGNRIRMRDV